MLRQTGILIVVAAVTVCEFWVFEDLPKFQKNISIIYQHFNRFNYSYLLETAVGYYDELKELTYAVDYGDHEADLMLRQLCDEGGPLHAYDPPYKEIAECYCLTQKERVGYEDLINKTCKVWNALKVKVKEAEDLESESSGNF